MKCKTSMKNRKTDNYQRWNPTTLLCFERKCHCEGCSNKDACNLPVDYLNEYGILNVKYAVLQTFANIGVKKE